MSYFKTSFHNCPPALQRRWRLVRWFVPRRRRWFFEGCLDVPGQLWISERKLLYETIRRYKPQTVFEVGTWYGGGSTYFISQALYENGGGVLHTIEENAEAHARAKENYARYLPHLLTHVQFHCGKSTEVYPALLREQANVDALFLDGAADPTETMAEFELFEPYLGAKSVMLMHDWDNEKMESLRPRLEASPEWKQMETLTGPYSLGFAVWTRKRVARDE